MKTSRSKGIDKRRPVTEDAVKVQGNPNYFEPTLWVNYPNGREEMFFPTMR